MIEHLCARLNKIIGDKADTTQKTFSALKNSQKTEYYHPSIKGNAFVLSKNEFQKLCFLLEVHTSREVKTLSILEFYNLKELVKEKNKTNGRK